MVRVTIKRHDYIVIKTLLGRENDSDMYSSTENNEKTCFCLCSLIVLCKKVTIKLSYITNYPIKLNYKLNLEINIKMAFLFLIS